MSQIAQILSYIKSLNERFNLLSANAKKVGELPVMETMNPEALLMVSEVEAGVYKSKQLQIQKIIEGVSLAGQNNKVREVLLGTITAGQDLNYLLDNNGLVVTENEIIVLTALATVNNTLVQKQYLWKLGKGEFNPIGSTAIETKILELQPKFLNEIIADELTNSPQAIVYDFGTITNPIVTVLNTASPARNYTDEEKIYYIRAVKDGVSLLYNFIGTNGTYGSGALQMVDADLVLVYSSQNIDLTSLIENKLDKGTYPGNAQDLDDAIKSIQFPDGVLKTGEIQLTGLNLSVVENAFSWRINQVDFLAPPAYSAALAAATENNFRYDLLQGNNAGEYSIKQGPEALIIGTPPSPDVNCIALGSVLIFGDTVEGIPEVPSTGDEFVTKISKSFIRMFYTGVMDVVSINDRSFLKFEQGMTGLKSLNIPNQDDFYFGKRYIIKNGTNEDVTVFHNQGTGSFKFNIPSGQDIILKPEESIELILRAINSTNNGGIIDYIGVAIDISGKADTSYVDAGLATKLDASAYNDRYKGKYTSLVALETAHPTGNAGDYAQVDTGAGSDVVNYSYDVEDGWIEGGSGSGASDTDALPEGASNLYFTTARVLSTLLTGLSLVAGGAIVSTDSVLVAFGKLQKQINDNLTAIGLKEDSLNKSTTLDADKTSNTKYPSVKSVYDWAVGFFQPILVSGTNIKTINGTSILGSGDMTISSGGGDMTTTTDQPVSGIKTFLAGKLGLRNVANTFTSFFTNANTAIRTYTLQNRDGTLADLTDIASVNTNKMNVPTGGIANYLPKFLTATTQTISRLLDTGTFFGIGTTNTPTKDITLGNQADREIGVEESSNTIPGRGLKVSAGRTINYVPNINFNSLSQTSRNWGSMTSVSNGNIYAAVRIGDIYMQTGGSGNFLPLSQTSRNWWSITSAPNGNVYASVDGGDIYMQNNNTVGSPNLNGGTMQVAAGTGKGTGQSRIEFITGQKTASGTDMQIETLRGYFDENGYFIYLTPPVYANDAAADADTNLPSKAYYKLTGSRILYQKP